MKIMLLIPCLMLENNRQFNQKSISFNMTHLPIDEVVVYDQCFEERDFIDGIVYIGNAQKRMGWVEPRNKLLQYFYNSDFDYALWVDANSTFSTPTLNDIVTIIKSIQSGNLSQCDSIFSTLGMWVSGDRIKFKSEPEFLDNVTLMPNPCSKAYNWMHGLLHKNFKKYYNQEFYIDERCDTRKGTPDDVYFARLLNRFTASYVAPTVVLNKPDSRASCTWANDKGTYDYPPVLFDVVDKYIFDNEVINGFKNVSQHKLIECISIPRDEYMKDKIRVYKPRSKKTTTLRNIPDLFGIGDNK